MTKVNETQNQPDREYNKIHLNNKLPVGVDLAIDTKIIIEAKSTPDKKSILADLYVPTDSDIGPTCIVLLQAFISFLASSRKEIGTDNYNSMIKGAIATIEKQVVEAKVIKQS